MLTLFDALWRPINEISVKKNETALFCDVMPCSLEESTYTTAPCYIPAERYFK